MTPDLDSRARQLLADIGLKEPSRIREVVTEYDALVAFVANELRQVAVEAREAALREAAALFVSRDEIGDDRADEILALIQGLPK